MTQATDPTITVSAWLGGILRADTLLRTLAPGDVWEDRPPQQNGIWPVIVMGYAGDAVDVRPMTDFVMADLSYRVIAMDNAGDYAGVEAAALRVLALLDNQQGPAAGGTVFYCQRARVPSIIRFEEVTEGGELFKHLGYEFRFLAR